MWMGSPEGSRTSWVTSKPTATWWWELSVHGILWYGYDMLWYGIIYISVLYGIGIILLSIYNICSWVMLDRFGKSPRGSPPFVAASNIWAPHIWPVLPASWNYGIVPKKNHPGLWKMMLLPGNRSSWGQSCTIIKQENINQFGGTTLNLLVHNPFV